MISSATFFRPIRTWCSEHVNLFIDAYWAYVSKRTSKNASLENSFKAGFALANFAPTTFFFRFMGFRVERNRNQFNLYHRKVVRADFYTKCKSGLTSLTHTDLCWDTNNSRIIHVPSSYERTQEVGRALKKAEEIIAPAKGELLLQVRTLPTS